MTFSKLYGTADGATNLGITMIECGNIGGAHLRAYEHADRNVVALCDIDKEALKSSLADFFPEADL